MAPACASVSCIESPYCEHLLKRQVQSWTRKCHQGVFFFGTFGKSAPSIRDLQTKENFWNGFCRQVVSVFSK